MILVQTLRIKPKPITFNSSFTRILDVPKTSATEAVARKTPPTPLAKQCSVESDTQTIKNPVSTIIDYEIVLSKFRFIFKNSPDGHLSDSFNPIQSVSQRSYVSSHEDTINDDVGISSSSIDDPSDLSSGDEDDNCMKDKVRITLYHHR